MTPRLALLLLASLASCGEPAVVGARPPGSHQTPYLEGREVLFCTVVDSIRPTAKPYQDRRLQLGDGITVELRDAWPQMDHRGDPAFFCALAEEDHARFAEWTASVVGQEIAVVADDQVVYAMGASAPVENGIFMVGGGRQRQDEVDEVVTRLRGDDVVERMRASDIEDQVSLPTDDGGRLEGLCRGGVPVGTWTRYHASGAKASEGGYAGGDKHGRWTYWSEDGEQELEVVFDHGVQQAQDEPLPAREG